MMKKTQGNSENVLVSDEIIEHGFHENLSISQSRVRASTPETNEEAQV